jgi:hypothetical protein
VSETPSGKTSRADSAERAGFRSFLSRILDDTLPLGNSPEQIISSSVPTMTKNMIFGSVAVAGLVILVSILDMTLKFPFGGYSITTDILFLVGAVIVLYMGWETYREI